MNSVELTHPEQVLLRRAEKSAHPWYSWKWRLAFLFLPVVFVVVGFYTAHRLSEDFEYAFCVRLSDGIFHPLPVSFVRIWDTVIVFLSVFMFLSCYGIIQIWRERRLLHSIVSKLRSGRDQP